MTIQEFEAIVKAIELVQSRQGVNKLEAPKWSVYRVGLIVRVDIKE